MKKRLKEKIKRLCEDITHSTLEEDEFKHYCWYCGNSHYDLESGDNMNTVAHEKDCIYLLAIHILEILNAEIQK